MATFTEGFTTSVKAVTTTVKKLLRRWFKKTPEVQIGNAGPPSWRFINAIWFRVLYVLVAIPLQMMLWLGAFFLFVQVIEWLFEIQFNLNQFMLIGLLLISLWLSLPKVGGSFRVPNAHVAVLTIFGMRIPFFLKEGLYPDFTNGLLFGRSTEELPGEGEEGTTFTAVGGFVNMGRLPFQIWDDREDKKPDMINVAKNGANLIANLLIEIQIKDPKLVLDSGDPLLSIAERTRTAFRTGIAFFTDRDNATVKTIIVKLMMGHTIITSFINDKRAKRFDQGSVVRDTGGRAMIEIVTERPEGFKPGDSEETSEGYKTRVKKGKKKFRKKLKNEADEQQLQLVPERDGKRVVYHLSVDQSLDEVLDQCGCELISASVSNVRFSRPVEEAANAASREAFEARKMLDSAAAQADSEQMLAKGRSEGEAPVDDLDRSIIAAQDNPNFRISHVSSSGGTSEVVKLGTLLADKDRGGTDKGRNATSKERGENDEE
jgi:hypothetical protein